MPDTDFDGINDDKDSAKKDNNFEGKMHYTIDHEEKTCNVEFSVDYRDFFNNNTTYNDEPAVLASLYASDIYADNYIQVTGGATGGSNNATSFVALFGLADAENIFIDSDNYTSDKDDVTDFVIGHCKVEHRGETREIIILSVRGTNGTNAEWSSNFDVGADTEEYYNAMGSEHPYWKNKINHKGFDVTANRVLEKVEDYISRYGLNDSSINKSILITGHSLGAGISNLLGAHFENDGSYKSFTYTFASPYTTTDSNAGN